MNKFGELSGMSAGEQHVVHINDEEDERPISSWFGEQIVVLIALGEADRLDEVVKLLILLSGCLFQAV